MKFRQSSELQGLHEWIIVIARLTLIIQWRTPVKPISKVRNVLGLTIYWGIILAMLIAITLMLDSMFGII